MIRAFRVHPANLYLPRFSTSIDRYTRRGINRPGLNLNVGQHIGDFTLQAISKYKHSNSTLLKFLHSSGLQYFHVDCPSIDNTFAIVVKNNLTSDQGQAYVLEKMLQCGCAKYNVRDAIEQMKNRSFNSANLVETNQDFMIFPFQTHATRDFYNLMDVYFNMVYNPLLRLQDFLATRGNFRFLGNNPKDDLEFTGPVYNESLTSEQLIEFSIASAINEHLFSKKYTPLGKAHRIFHLTNQQVKEYHKENFTLKNSLLYSYGDLNPVDHIQNIERLIKQIKISAKGSQKQPQKIQQKSENKDSLPKTVNIKHMQPYTVFMLCYKLGALTPEQQVRMQILSYLLFDLPDSPLQKWLDLNLPFPRNYGMRGENFNIGMCFKTDKITETILRQKQIEILNQLKDFAENGFPHSLVQTCLSHLQASSMLDNIGLKALTSFTNGLSQPILQASPLIQKLTRQLTKKDVFSQLIKKHLLNTKQYIRIVGESDSDLTENILQKNREQLQAIKYTLSEADKQKILQYKPSTEVQDPSRLPIIKLTDYEFIEQNKHQQLNLAGIKAYFLEKPTLPSITLKFDITDLPEDYFNVLEIFCKALPMMGYRAIDKFTYEAFLDRYIHNVDLWFSPFKDPSGGMKLYLFFQVQFLPRNAEFAFNILNGLINRPNFANLTKLSEAVHKLSSEFYNKVSERCTQYGVASANKQTNAFLKLQDPTFHARSACSVAIQMLKVTNPKNILQQLSDRLKTVHETMVGKNRLEILIQCQDELKSVIQRYLSLVLSALPEGKKPEIINTDSFVGRKIKTYYPNFQQGFVFESFATSYLQKDTPAVTVLASTINESIRRHKLQGCCLAYKGSLTAFLRGDKKQFLDLEKHYFNNIDLDAAKRRLFQNYRQHSILHEFKYGVQRDTVRYFKQAVLASTVQDVQTVRDKYIGQAIKKQNSNMVIFGPHLENYEGLIKTGWTIQRILDETSLSMESNSKIRTPLLENTKYLRIS